MLSVTLWVAKKQNIVVTSGSADRETTVNNIDSIATTNEEMVKIQTLKNALLIGLIEK